MPKSKMPRKKFDPKRHLRAFTLGGFTKVEADKLYQKFLTLELKAETTLLKGLCKHEDMADLMDFLQWGKIAIANRDYYENSARIQAQEALIKAADAIDSLIKRGVEREHYVGTADELNAIRDGMEIVGPLMCESIQTVPHMTAKEWLLMLRYSRGTKGRNVELGQLKADLRRIAL